MVDTEQQAWEECVRQIVARLEELSFSKGRHV